MADPWSDRLLPVFRQMILPAYFLAEAARYARTSPSTARYWLYGDQARQPVLPGKERRAELSYLQLVELAFVAALRKRKMSLEGIRRARDYLSRAFSTEYPFASVRLKTDGRHILVDLRRFEPLLVTDDLVAADRGGQIVLAELVSERLEEFDYLEGLAISWHPAGRGSPVCIDPRVAFGAPQVEGVPTWIIRDRFRSGDVVAHALWPRIARIA